MQSKAHSVDDYLAGIGEVSERAFLAKLRALIRRVAPRATESMEYGMPTYKVEAEAVCAFNRQKNYFSLYADPDVVQAHRSELPGLDCGKSCIRFKKTTDLPWEVAETVLRETARRHGAT